MVGSSRGSWDSLRKAFADQFEQDGTGFVYRRSQKGEAIRVSAEERRKFVDGFDRNVRRSKWMIYLGLSLVLGGILALSLLENYEVSQVATFAAFGLAMIPYFAFNQWAWSAPARELAGRTPIAGELSSDEVRRLRFQRISYGQLAGVAAGGVAIPFIGGSHQDLFSGWNRLWLLLGSALVLLAAVQAFRKWRFEQEDSYRNIISPPSGRGIVQTTEESNSPGEGQVRRYFIVGAFFVAVAFIAFTPAGKRLAQTPGFWPILIVGFAGWSLFTVAQGFAKGEIEPFARGFYNSYQRETQPKRFWASMTWNAIFGCLCLWLAFSMNQDSKSQSVRDRCSNEGGKYSPKDALSACNRLVELQPKEPDAYMNRGMIFLDDMKLDQAVADFTRAHELDPASPWPLADRGISYAWKDDRERAEKDFKTVRKIDPTNPVLFRGEAFLNIEAGNLEAAIRGLSVQLARDPTDTWSLRMRSDAYQQLGDFERARADRERLLQLSNAPKAETATS
jgi:regulator of sirC expression with transglutaminase-like and TPR domain/MFS family permease